MAEACLLGSASFTSYPGGAEIFMDSMDQAVITPAIITNVPAGAHAYVLKLAGYKDYQGYITVLESQTAELSANLIPDSSKGFLIGLSLMGLGTLGVVRASKKEDRKWQG